MQPTERRREALYRGTDKGGKRRLPLLNCFCDSDEWYSSRAINETAQPEFKGGTCEGCQGAGVQIVCYDCAMSGSQAI